MLIIVLSHIIDSHNGVQILISSEHCIESPAPVAMEEDDHGHVDDNLHATLQEPSF